MHRTLALSVLVGSLVAGAGCCKHIAGKCDCTYNPADAILPQPHNPYFAGQTFSGPVPPAKSKDPEPATEPEDQDEENSLPPVSGGAGLKKMSFAAPEFPAVTDDGLPAVPAIPVINP